jgi:hypothetical protein
MAAATERTKAAPSVGAGRLAISPVFLFIAAAGLAVTLILGLAAGLSFHGDEWAYIVDRRLTIESMLQPHNEHLAFLHVLVYRGLVELVGTTSYLPFLAVLMACHVAMAAGVYALMRRAVSIEAALAAAVLMLFLGSGFDNLLWAFQIGFVGAAALGAWALVMADRPAVCAVLLTLALWTSGNGLFYLAPAAVLIARRRWLILPVASYAVWFVMVGRESVPVPPVGPFLDYAVRLIGSVVGGAAGFGPAAGVVILGLVVAGLVAQRATPSRFVVAGLVGLASMALILAFGRAHFGPEQAEAPRYIYVALPFVLLTLTGVRGVPRSVWATVFALALALNVLALPRGVAIYHAFLNYDRSLTIEQRLAPFRP